MFLTGEQSPEGEHLEAGWRGRVLSVLMDPLQLTVIDRLTSVCCAQILSAPEQIIKGFLQLVLMFQMF